MPPPLWHLPIAIVAHNLYAIFGLFPIQVMLGIAMGPRESKNVSRSVEELRSSSISGLKALGILLLRI